MYAVMVMDADGRVLKLFATKRAAKTYYDAAALKGCYSVVFFELNEDSGLLEEVFSV